MKKNKFLYILLLSVLFVACDKEDNLTPSNLGKDWFTIENSDDPVDRAIYQFYVETGIPVFLAEDPTQCVIQGAGRLTQDADLLHLAARNSRED